MDWRWIKAAMIAFLGAINAVLAYSLLEKGHPLIAGIIIYCIIRIVGYVRKGWRKE